MKDESILSPTPTRPLRSHGARLLLAVLMCATLAACGDSAEPPPPAEKPADTADPARNCSVKSPHNRCAP
jgi:hypothetical protein